MLIFTTLAFNFYIIFGQNLCPTTCECQGHILHCNRGQTPESIPNTTKEVHITDFEPRPIGNQPFSHPSWSNILKLELMLRYPSNISYIAGYLFNGLKHLQYLGIHGVNTQQVNEQNVSLEMTLNIYTFYGLNNVTTLNLSGNPSLNITEITNSLRPTFILPKLQCLIISELQNLDSEPIDLYHMNDFVYSLPPKPIKTLIMDKIKFEINFDYLPKLCSTLEHFFITNTYVGSVYNQQNFVCTNLKLLDLTNSTVPFLQALMKIRFPPSAGHVDNFNKFYSFVFTPETVILDNIIPAYPKPLTFTEGWVYESTRIKFRTKYLNFRQNHVKSLNVSFLNIPFLPGSEIDVSQNEIEFIHPRCIDPGKNIRKINVSHNKLYKMEQNHCHQFGQFLQNFVNLEDLDISSNGLRSIPYEMFQQNVKLRKLSLANNFLRTISFNLEDLIHLQFIDLSNNMLVNLEEEVIHQFDTLSRLRNGNFSIALGSNNFKCDCQESKFVGWIKGSQYLNGKNYFCSFNGKIYDLKADAQAEVKSICQQKLLQRISIIISCVAASIIGILVIIFILFHRYKKRHIKIAKILDFLKSSHPNQDFLVFLSYCSEDADLVNKEIFHQLNDEICKRVGKRGTYVCNDEHHFRPGFPIVTEIMSNIEKSCVMVCVTSQAYCNKTWCQMEVEEAYSLQKPIILMIKDEIDESHLPKLMLRLFQRNTRAKVTKGKDGKHELNPPFGLLCSAILDLAAGSHAHTDLETELIKKNSPALSRKDTSLSVSATNSSKEKVKTNNISVSSI